MSLANVNTAVRVILNGEEILICERYSVQISTMTVPAIFSATFGHPGLVVDLMKRFPPGTPFELQVAGTTQFTGRTDGWSYSGDTLELSGRDKLALLHDSYARSEMTFKDVSIAELCRKIFDIVYGAGNYKLVAGNGANRAAQSNAKGKAANKLGAAQKSGGGGVKATAENKANLADAGVDLAVLLDSGPNVQRKPIQVKLGMRWYGDVLKPQLDRAGLFLWSAADGTFFIVAGLNKNQSPLYRLRHRRQNVDNVVEQVSFENNTAGRFSKCEIWSRRGGGAESRSKVSASFVDDEMVALGFDRPLVLEDAKTSTPQQAQFRARQKIGESRRAGWKLEYTIGGHTLPHASDPAIDVVIIPDTIIDVDDEETGISGPHYIESVEHRGDPGMTTKIRLMRPADMVFGDATDEG